MYTLEEIKRELEPSKVDYIEMMKDLIKIKGLENKLLEFKHNIVLYSIGDPNLVLGGVALVNDTLFALAFSDYGGDIDSSYFGKITIGNKATRSTIGVPQSELKKALKVVFDERLEKYKWGVYAYDFTTFEGYDWYNEFLFKGENMEILRALLEGKEEKIIEF